MSYARSWMPIRHECKLWHWRLLRTCQHGEEHAERPRLASYLYILCKVCYLLHLKHHLNHFHLGGHVFSTVGLLCRITKTTGWTLTKLGGKIGNGPAESVFFLHIVMDFLANNE